MVMRHPTLSVVRTATLCAEEVRLLARHPAGAWALGEAESASRAGEPAAGQG
jgi:hypothetical protein